MWPGCFSSGRLSCFISLLTILFFLSKLLGSLVLDLPHGKVDKNVAFSIFHFWEVSSIVLSNPLLFFVILQLI